MTQADKLLTELRVACPTHQFDKCSKVHTAYVDDDEAAEELVGVVLEDGLIHDLFSSECGRFSANPEQDYGVPLAIARRIAAHNRINLSAAGE